MADHTHGPLQTKLGIKAGMRLYLDNAPRNFIGSLGELDEVTTFVDDPELANFFHYFVVRRSHLHQIAEKLQHFKAPDQIVWISWPKNSSKIKTDVTERDIREALLPTGLVSIKTETITDVYDGIKFSWRKK